MALYKVLRGFPNLPLLQTTTTDNGRGYNPKALPAKTKTINASGLNFDIQVLAVIELSTPPRHSGSHPKKKQMRVTTSSASVPPAHMPN